MTDRGCRRHQWELAEGTCASCTFGYCGECLIYVKGPHKPPLCVQCALAKSGVRAGGRSPRRSWRQRRHEEKVRKHTEVAMREARQQAELRAAGEDVGSFHGIAGLEPNDAVGSWASPDTTRPS